MKIRKRLKALRPSQLTPHFNVREFKCHDGTGYIKGLKKFNGLTGRAAKARATALAEYLEQVRKKCGSKPLRLNSVYRTPSYNKAIGGVKNSAHTRGFAADIAPPAGVTQEQLHKVVRAVFPSGCGNYPSSHFVHGDFDPILGHRDWTG